MKYYFSFGFGHTHYIEGIKLDRKSLVTVEVPDIADSVDVQLKARRIFTDFLGNETEWAFQRSEAEFVALGESRSKYFPRGVVKELRLL